MLQLPVIEHKTDFYINGLWRAPHSPKTLEVVNPATEEPYAFISVDRKSVV